MSPKRAGKRQVFLLSFIVLFCFSAEVFANGAPYLQDIETATGNIMPVKENRVSILHEELHLNVVAEKEAFIFNPNVHVHVHVIYEMMNRSPEQVEVPVAFPQNDSTGEWVVLLDGDPVPLEGEKDLKWEQVGETVDQLKWIDPRTGEEYEFKSLYRPISISELKAQTFTLHLTPGGHRLEVKYSVRAGVDETRWLNPVYSFDYLLLPASYWQDFGTLKITLKIPFSHYLYSSLPLNRINSEIWEASFDHLPEKNLHLYFSSKSGTWGGLVSTRNGALLVLGAIVLLYAFLRRRFLVKLPMGYSSAIELILASLVAWAGYYTFNRKLFKYPLNGVQHLLFWGLLGWLYIPLIHRFWNKVRKKMKEIQL